MKTVLVPGVAWPTYIPRRRVRKRKYDELGEIRRVFDESGTNEKVLMYLRHTQKRLTKTQLAEKLALTPGQIKGAIETLLVSKLIAGIQQRATYRRQTLWHYYSLES